ncbi:MAG: hypothetical protein COW19_11355 [Zetaproteobacteria bacterium CG12_big_fil_rev_8_21_14_0_65_55_1124]|nr:MAG: hypothetical protein AUJ58_02475 [Zetaproteobacteria bacterium CG1_02_55_237]PIS19036.1 MAG: hypothetical protein COT53_07595 [Zetaproteobacteria bacterium CG08_land_8_20_14_0_20_55_17]PIW41817.1 MAG: hypothetical protein COW19_11355 [Zetaproteobacteria bacterium CG12_big_fil_rev_8_21_14_0_65_55_1124]PIY54053.1 MAG: hypothetical protein COZ01_01605 [Zetaproteobacteria bacterium CG_4_10_14_0_8_um_filter_55_43]PIZ40228.1 MAG: hypothetical protein COY36_00135 [Zetaproteobacteria bacterium 
MTTLPLKYAQDTFADVLKEVEADRSPINRESIWRRVMAYGLKTVAVIGGIAIASGIKEDMAHYVGIAITTAVAVDGIFSNHMRMIAVTKAAQAYGRVLKQAKRLHQQGLGPILKQMEKYPEKGEQELLDLLQKLTEQIHSECTLIELALDEMQIKALDMISVAPKKGKKLC